VIGFINQHKWIFFVSPALIFFFIIPQFLVPAEDAAILYQYSENLANSGVISYNSYDKPAEGATDFLWMVFISILHITGFSSYVASNILSFFSLVFTSLIIYKLTKLDNIFYYLSIFLYLSILPFIPGSILGFSPLFFGFAICLSSYLLIKKNEVLFFVSILGLCLIRPEGFFIGFGLVISYLLIIKENLNKQTFLNIFLYLILPGLIYFFWRWEYFGELLPLPFYVKTNFEPLIGIFNYSSLIENFKIILIFIPFLIFNFYLLRKSEKLHKIIWSFLFLSLVIIPFLAYSSISLSQNVSLRFQYPIVLGIFISLSYLIGVNTKQVSKKLLLAILIIQLIFFSPLSARNFLSLIAVSNENIPSLAKELSKFEPKGNMLVTEAGRLPYYSKWHTTDAWGLNSPEFSKKLITSNEVTNGNFDLIVVHTENEDYSNIFNKNISTFSNHKSWKNMTDNIFSGIDLNSYTLLMVPFRVYSKDSIYNFLNSYRKTNKLKRYDAFFVSKNYQHSNKLIKLLLDHEALPFSNYVLLNHNAVN